jgi:predicted ATPase
MITSLSLKNFKCFKSLENLDFKQITVLTGSNGRGKSSILQSILLLAQSFRSGKNIEYVKFNGRFICLGTYDDVLTKNSDSGEMSIRVKSDDIDENDVLFSCKPFEGNSRLADMNSMLITYTNGIKKDLVNRVGGDGDDSNSNSATSKSATSAVAVVNQLRNIYYVSADRVGPTNYVTHNDDITESHIGTRGEYVINALNDEGTDLLNQVANEISTIMGGASVHVNEIDTEYLKLLLDSQDDQRGFKPVNVGFGYSFILPIVTLPLILKPNSKLIIENPEAHLHPGAQSRLMKYLIRISKERNFQLFIETHSDHIVNALRIAIKNSFADLNHKDAIIIHVGRDEVNSEPKLWQIMMDKNGNLSDYPEDFMDEWTKQMLSLV